MSQYIVSDNNLWEVFPEACNGCGDDVAEYLCNDSVIKERPEAACEDYWLSCTNEKCCNHYGEGYLQFKPEWFTIQ